MVKIHIALLVLASCEIASSTFLAALKTLLIPPKPQQIGPPAIPLYPTYKAYVDPNPPKPPIRPKYVPKPYPDYRVSFASPGSGIGTGGMYLNYAADSMGNQNFLQYQQASYTPNLQYSSDLQQYSSQLQSSPTYGYAQQVFKNNPLPHFSEINTQELTSQFDIAVPPGSTIDVNVPGTFHSASLTQDSSNIAMPTGAAFGQANVLSGIEFNTANINELLNNQNALRQNQNTDDLKQNSESIQATADALRQNFDAVKQNDDTPKVPKEPLNFAPTTDATAIRISADEAKKTVDIDIHTDQLGRLHSENPTVTLDALKNDFRLVFVTNQSQNAESGEFQSPRSVFSAGNAGKAGDPRYFPGVSNPNLESANSIFYKPQVVDDQVPEPAPSQSQPEVPPSVANDPQIEEVNSPVVEEVGPSVPQDSPVEDSLPVADVADSAASFAEDAPLDTPVRSPAIAADAPSSGGFGNPFSGGIGNLPQMLSSALGNSRNPTGQGQPQDFAAQGQPQDFAAQGQPQDFAPSQDFVPQSGMQFNDPGFNNPAFVDPGQFQNGFSPAFSGSQYQPYAPMYFQSGYADYGSMYMPTVMNTDDYGPPEEMETMTLLVEQPNEMIGNLPNHYTNVGFRQHPIRKPGYTREPTANNVPKYVKNTEYEPRPHYKDQKNIEHDSETNSGYFFNHQTSDGSSVNIPNGQFNGYRHDSAIYNQQKPQLNKPSNEDYYEESSVPNRPVIYVDQQKSLSASENIEHGLNVNADYFYKQQNIPQNSKSQSNEFIENNRPLGPGDDRRQTVSTYVEDVEKIPNYNQPPINDNLQKPYVDSGPSHQAIPKGGFNVYATKTDKAPTAEFISDAKNSAKLDQSRNEEFDFFPVGSLFLSSTNEPLEDFNVIESTSPQPRVSSVSYVESSTANYNPRLTKPVYAAEENIDTSFGTPDDGSHKITNEDFVIRAPIYNPTDESGYEYKPVMLVGPFYDSNSNAPNPHLNQFGQNYGSYPKQDQIVVTGNEETQNFFPGRVYPADDEEDTQHQSNDEDTQDATYKSSFIQQESSAVYSNYDNAITPHTILLNDNNQDQYQYKPVALIGPFSRSGSSGYSQTQYLRGKSADLDKDDLHSDVIVNYDMQASSVAPFPKRTPIIRKKPMSEDDISVAKVYSQYSTKVDKENSLPQETSVHEEVPLQSSHFEHVVESDHPDYLDPVLPNENSYFDATKSYERQEAEAIPHSERIAFNTESLAIQQENQEVDNRQSKNLEAQNSQFEYKPLLVAGPFYEQQDEGKYKTDETSFPSEISQPEHPNDRTSDTAQQVETQQEHQTENADDEYKPLLIAGPLFEQPTDENSRRDHTFEYQKPESLSNNEEYKPLLVAGPFYEQPNEENFDLTHPANRDSSTTDNEYKPILLAGPFMPTNSDAENFIKDNEHLENKQQIQSSIPDHTSEPSETSNDETDEIMLPPNHSTPSVTPTSLMEEEYKPVLIAGPFQPKGDNGDEETNSSPTPDTDVPPKVYERWRTPSPRRKLTHSRRKMSDFFPTTYHPFVSSNDETNNVVTDSASERSSHESVDNLNEGVFGMKIHPKIHVKTA